MLRVSMYIGYVIFQTIGRTNFNIFGGVSLYEGFLWAKIQNTYLY